MNSKQINQQKIAPWLFLSPFIILFLIFGVFPLCYGIFLSLQEWRGAGTARFTGLNHYIKLLSGQDPYFWKAAGTTGLLFVSCFLPQHCLAFFLALILNRPGIKGKKFFCTIYIIPYITSTISLAVIFAMFYNYRYGLFNYLLELPGLPRQDWLQNSRSLQLAAAIFINWKYLGWNILLYFMGMQAVPPEYYEAARVEGANAFTRHIHITVPVLLPVVFFALGLSMLAGAELFTGLYQLTGGYMQMGGSGNALFTVAFYIMWLFQREMNWGKGAAVSVLLFIMVSALILINRKLSGFLSN